MADAAARRDAGEHPDVLHFGQRLRPQLDPQHHFGRLACRRREPRAADAAGVADEQVVAGGVGALLEYAEFQSVLFSNGRERVALAVGRQIGDQQPLRIQRHERPEHAAAADGRFDNWRAQCLGDGFAVVGRDAGRQQRNGFRDGAEYADVG